MGCGQSKINLYPRKNKNGGKGNSSKKSGAADKEADEEDGLTGAGANAAAPDDPELDPERCKLLVPLPLTAHPPPLEISASQQDFFKMLEEKIEKGKDYDSSSETEVRLEQERRLKLIKQWRSASLSTQSSVCQSSPPTPARRRQKNVGTSNSPKSPRKQCYRQHVTEGMSPPPRRSHSAQSHNSPHECRQNNGEWNQNETNKSPQRRPQSAGGNWKSSKIQKPKKNEVNEQQKQHVQNYDNSLLKQDSLSSYNQTFQSNSQPHTGKQPYIAQIVTYPITQQVTPPSTPKFIAPPEEYQDPKDDDDNKYSSTPTGSIATTPNQSQIYYIHGNSSTDLHQDLASQRQQTAIHLQQYVAMKQAQQQMFSYLQRAPHTVFPNMDYSQGSPDQFYDQQQYIHFRMTQRVQSAPVGVVRPMTPIEGTHVPQMGMWSPMPPVVSNVPPWSAGEMQYYPQSQIHMIRPNSAGSAGTLTRYHKDKSDDSQSKNNVCQSINLVRQKPVGQIVVGGQDLAVCANTSNESVSASSASLGSDSGVSRGNSASKEHFKPVEAPYLVCMPHRNMK